MFTLYGDHDATPEAATVVLAMLRESAAIAAVQGARHVEVSIEQIDTREGAPKNDF